MTKKMDDKVRVAARRFIKKFGGGTEIASMLNAELLKEDKKTITSQSVYNWKRKGKIPHKRLALIEQVYGVKPKTLRPDRSWVKPTNKKN